MPQSTSNTPTAGKTRCVCPRWSSWWLQMTETLKGCSGNVSSYSLWPFSKGWGVTVNWSFGIGQQQDSQLCVLLFIFERRNKNFKWWRSEKTKVFSTQAPSNMVHLKLRIWLYYGCCDTQSIKYFHCDPAATDTCKVDDGSRRRTPQNRFVAALGLQTLHAEIRGLGTTSSF